MIRYIAILTFLLAGVARAEMSLADLVGEWAGTGTYFEALSKAKMKCRLKAAGDAAKVTLTGRCGSSLGASDVDLDLVRQADGTVQLLSEDGAADVETDIQSVTGRITGNQLLLVGSAAQESLKMQFAINADGTVHFATERKWRTGNSRSTVTLRRR